LTEALNKRIATWNEVGHGGVPPHDGEGIVGVLWLARDGSEVWVFRDKGLWPEGMIIKPIT
jgi:hypothetical protein